MELEPEAGYRDLGDRADVLAYGEWWGGTPSPNPPPLQHTHTSSTAELFVRRLYLLGRMGSF